jgi:drug/metabolite transporter (DMT)-like permease
MIDQVTRSNIVPITTRMLQVSFSMFVSYYALKFFTTTSVTMVNQLSPMFTVLLAYFILKERLTIRECIVLLAAFMAVTLVILGGDEQSDQLYESNGVALAMLFLNPVAVALGLVMMRSMRKTSEWTVTCWVNTTQVFFLTVYYLYCGENYI